jgi:flagellar hook-associated protein 3 FlgL
MRISSQSQIDMIRHSVAANMATINKLTAQFQSGKRVEVPSDDPIASTLFMRVESENLNIEQYEKNISRVDTSIKLQEGNVEAVNTILGEIKNDLINVNVPGNGAVEIKSVAVAIEKKIDTLVSLLNKTNADGRYLHSGTKTDTVPVRYDSTNKKYEYDGNEESREIIVGNGVTEKDGVLLHQAFTDGADKMKVLTNLKELVGDMKESGKITNGVTVNGTTVNIADNLQDALKKVEGAAIKLDSIAGDLINRKQHLDILQTVQEQSKNANTQFGQKLVGMTIPEQYMLLSEMAQYQNAIRGTLQTFTKMAQLSIFNYMS